MVTFDRDELQIVDPSAHDSTAGNYVLTTGSRLAVSLREEALYWSHEQLQGILPESCETHFLGFYNGEPFFSADITAEDCRRIGARECNLRSLLGQYPEGFFNLLGRAVQINQWYREHRYCGCCGSETQKVEHERAMGCSQCGRIYYPRLSPCIMALVTRGDECLLARNKQWQRNNFFSVLAGFIEPGESVEDALRREVYEEVGLEVGRLHYFNSQPWPFPGQLMIGFFADYQGGDIRIDDWEIAEARWWHYTSLPAVPGEFSLSGQLIRHFVEQCRKRNGVQ